MERGRATLREGPNTNHAREAQDGTEDRCHLVRLAHLVIEYGTFGLSGV